MPLKKQYIGFGGNAFPMVAMAVAMTAVMVVDGRGRRREEEKTAALYGAGILLPLGVRGAVCARKIPFFSDTT